MISYPTRTRIFCQASGTVVGQVICTRLMTKAPIHEVADLLQQSMESKIMHEYAYLIDLQMMLLTDSGELQSHCVFVVFCL